MRKKITLSLTLLVLASFGIFTVSNALADDDIDYNKAHLNRALKGDKNLRWVNLEKTNLQGVNLKGANLRGADLEEANLENADLRGANLRNADLEEANLKGAKLDGAVLAGAELEDAIWVDGRVCADNSIGACG